VISIDTNILVRFLAEDDPPQTARAISLFANETIHLSQTVLLEAFWVLRKRLGLASGDVLAMLVSVTGLPNVRVEQADRFRRAVDLTSQGIDFADALHLSATPEGARFATFDRDVIRLANGAGGPLAFAP
jgi:predicted nucleic-acid-binding protein